MIDTLWSEFVEVRVMLGIGGNDGTDQTFTLDDATLGRLDYGRLGDVNAPFKDVTCDVRSLDWQFGATRTDGPLTRWEAGSAVVVFDNNEGTYDIGGDDSVMVPMVELRIDARLMDDGTGHVGAWIAQFTGYANAFTVAFDPATLDCTVTASATDGTAVLAAYDAAPLAAPVGAGESASARVARILDNAEWTGPRNLQAGGVGMAATDLSGDAWSQLVAVNDAELGAVYIAPNGAVTFKTRATVFGAFSNPTPVATFGPDAGQLRYEDAAIAVDDLLLRNIVDAAGASGVVQSVRNQASVASYLPHRYSRTDLDLNADADARAWASLVLNTLETPFPRVDSLTVMPRTDPTKLFPVVIKTAYLDRWHVKVQPPGSYEMDVEADVLVRGWHVSVDREDWTVSYATSSMTGFTSFILDDTDTMLDVIRLTA